MEININKYPTIWFTGLSVSGKTTLSTRLYKDLKSLGVNNVVLLDGEFMRDEMKNYMSIKSNYLLYVKIQIQN